MDSNFIVLLILQIIMISIIASIIYILIIGKSYRNIESRFNDYTIQSDKYNSISVFDKLYLNIWNIIHKLSSLLSKSVVMEKYGKRFDKNIHTYDIESKSGIDIVSIKFLISFSLGLLYCVSSLVRFDFNFMVLLLIVFVSFFIMDIYFIFDYKKKKKKIEDDLLSAIIIMNNAFKSGMNVMQAVEIAKNELSGPIGEEFKKISIDIKYGLSLESVFNRFYDRVKIEEIKYITSSLSLINKTGGNIVKVFSSIEKNFYDKKKINDEMQSLISSSIFMFRLLVLMPVLLIIVIYALNSSFFMPLFSTLYGRLVILLIVILYIMYIIVVRKILKVDV